MDLRIFDVEQGQCALLTCDNGTRLMIDCGHNGSTNWRPGTYLRQQGITYLDMLAVTNYDEDHVSGLPDLLKNVNVGWLWRNRSVDGETIRTLKSDTGVGPGMEALIDMMNRYTGSGAPGSEPQFMGVERSSYSNNYPTFDDENNLSMVVVLRCHGITVMFPGDMERAGWLKLLAEEPGLQRDAATVNVLNAAHHGRESGICSDLFEKYGCSPHFVVISDKGYMYDTQQTIPFYRSKSRGGPFRGDTRRVLTTRRDGRIGFQFGVGSWNAY